MRIAVIGGGIIGLACAYELARDGHETTVLDAGEPGHGASIGSAAKIALAECAPVPAPGMVLQGLKWMLDQDSPLYVRPSLSPNFVRFMFSMAKHCNAADFHRGLEIHLDQVASSLDILDEWKDQGISYEEHAKGILLAFETQESFSAHLRHSDLFEKYGHVAEILDADALHAKEPCLSNRIRHGLFYADDRQVMPQSLTDALVGKLVQMGQTVMANRRVVGFGRSGDRITEVRTEAESFPCDMVLLAAGAHCGPLSRMLGNPLPIRPGKGYSVDYPDPPTALSTPLTFEDAHVAVTPLNGFLRIAGTMEFTGFETKIRPRRVEAMKRAAVEGFRDWDPSKPHGAAWAGMRPMTPDGLPVVGRLPALANAMVATGHGMLGLTMAPTTAKSIVALTKDASVRESTCEIAPSRFFR